MRKMKKLVRFSILCMLFVLLKAESCNNKKVDALLPGYSFYDAPNDLDKTGLIFRVTPNGQRFNVGYIEILPDNGRIEIKSTAQTRTMSINALASFLKMDITKINTDGNLDLKKKITFKVKMANNQQESLTDFALDAKLKDAIKIIKKDREELGRQDDKYYVIRESILTQNLEYGFDKSIITNAGFNLALNDLIKVNSTAKWDDTKEFQLGFNYKNPLRVFYKAEYLSILSSAAGGIKIIRKPVDYEEIYSSFNR